MSIKISIVEDDDRIRGGISALINGTDGYECIRAYASAEVALKEIPNHKTDVILMDINLPGMSGIECVGPLKERTPKIQMIMLTVYEDSEKIFESLKAGASGYL